jgi:hypothetical protein
MIITVWVLTAILLATWGFGVLEILGIMFLLHLGAVFLDRLFLVLIMRRLVA